MEVDQQELEAAEKQHALVLGNGDLLDEILIRLDSPAFLILFCQANKFWTFRRRQPKLLPRFRDRLALRPRPLGFYNTFDSPRPRTRFVPMPHSSERADLVTRGNFGHFDHNGDPGDQSRVLDCGKGMVLLNLHRGDDGPYALLRPLDEGSSMSVLPEIVDTMDGHKAVWHLPDDCWEATVLVIDLSEFLSHTPPRVQLALLRHDGWSTDVYNATDLSPPGGLRLDNSLQHKNVYILSSKGCVLQLEFSYLNPITMKCVTIELPNEINFAMMFNDEIFDKHILSRGDGTGLYFIRLKGVRLFVWVMNAAKNKWLLDAKIYLPKAFGQLAQFIGPDQTEEQDGATYDVLRIFRAGDYADSVFLVDGTFDYQHIFFLNIRTKRVEIVYNRLPGDCGVIDIHPFIMV